MVAASFCSALCIACLLGYGCNRSRVHPCTARCIVKVFKPYMPVMLCSQVGMASWKKILRAMLPKEVSPDWCRLVSFLYPATHLPVQLLLKVLCVLQDIVTVVCFGLHTGRSVPLTCISCIEQDHHVLRALCLL